MAWYVYIIESTAQTLYTGVTTDVARRFEEHRTGRGAKYFRVHAPKEIVFVERKRSRATAQARERAIKKLSSLKKRELCERYAAVNSG